MKKFFSLLVMLGIITGCSSFRQPAGEPLRVGITPNFPPLIFSNTKGLAGLEMDLMRKLGRELGRPVTVVVLPFNEQIDALIAGRTDIIMSGLSVNEARQVRIAFSDPWLNSGLLAMMRRVNADQFTTVDDVLNFTGNIGVEAGTTAEEFVRNHCRQARVIRIARADDAVLQLRRRTIDLFIHDIPAVAWQVSANKGELAALLKPLNREEIAWGMRISDRELATQVNAALARWQADGSLRKAISNWVPYYDQLEQAD
ncbi:MAG TPA: transporter substrate-binding domain-containing protein [Kiritimatiellia bacterium]|nr:transporter substrate-binding domain-containing protein [Kiritimatiellia bacterium]HMO99810.1 transporter substrate-binding domain-containing protein [Kiritimatiellia bacterium]HMP97460.1 transporter substrate-binding domain-containing protein [Kiritimatiellia bacterium]